MRHTCTCSGFENLGAVFIGKYYEERAHKFQGEHTVVKLYSKLLLALCDRTVCGRKARVEHAKPYASRSRYRPPPPNARRRPPVRRR